MYLDSEAYDRLAGKIRDAEITEAVTDAVMSCAEYVAGVVESETKTVLARTMYDGQEYREAVMNYDAARSRKHNAAIANVKMLNRIAASFETGPVFTGDADVRVQVAEFCMELTEYIFRNRKL